MGGTKAVWFWQIWTLQEQWIFDIAVTVIIPKECLKNMWCQTYISEIDFLSKIDDSVFGGYHLWTSYWGNHTGRKGKLNVNNFRPTIFTMTKPVEGIVILKNKQTRQLSVKA